MYCVTHKTGLEIVVRVIPKEGLAGTSLLSVTVKYCREPPPMGLRGYGGLRTVKLRAPSTGDANSLPCPFLHHTRLSSGLLSDTAKWMGRNNIICRCDARKRLDLAGLVPAMHSLDVTMTKDHQACFSVRQLICQSGF